FDSKLFKFLYKSHLVYSILSDVSPDYSHFRAFRQRDARKIRYTLKMQKKRILITGASGGLGAALYQHWQADYEVLGLCFQHPAPGLLPLDLRQREPIV